LTPVPLAAFTAFSKAARHVDKCNNIFGQNYSTYIAGYVELLINNLNNKEYVKEVIEASVMSIILGARSEAVIAQKIAFIIEKAKKLNLKNQPDRSVAELAYRCALEHGVTDEQKQTGIKNLQSLAKEHNHTLDDNSIKALLLALNGKESLAVCAYQALHVCVADPTHYTLLLNAVNTTKNPVSRAWLVTICTEAAFRAFKDNDKSSTTSLLKAGIKHGNSKAKINILKCIYAMGKEDSAYTSSYLADELLRLVNDKDPDVRVQAITAMSTCKTDATRKLLINLAQKFRSPHLDAAIRALGYYYNDTEAALCLCRIAMSSVFITPKSSAEAVKSLSRYCAEIIPAWDFFTETVSTEDIANKAESSTDVRIFSKICSVIADVLKKTKKNQLIIAEAAADAFGTMLDSIESIDDTDKTQYGYTEMFRFFISTELEKALISHRYDSVRIKAADALSRAKYYNTKYKNPLDSLPIVLNAEETPADVRIACADAMRGVAEDSRYEAYLLKALLSFPDAAIRNAVIDALGKVGTENSINLLVEALHNSLKPQL